MRRIIIASVLTLALAVSCSDSDHGSTAAGSGGSTSGTSANGGSAAGPPAESCAQPGDKGNNKGVGEYCTPAGSECSDFPEAALCLASVGQDQWFCTRIGCDASTDCGADAACLIDGAGSACVPCRCSDHCSGSGGGGGN